MFQVRTKAQVTSQINNNNIDDDDDVMKWKSQLESKVCKVIDFRDFMRIKKK